MRLREFISEAVMSTTIQGRNPISAGARGLMAGRWKYDTVLNASEKDNITGALHALAAALDQLDKIDYTSLHDAFHTVARNFNVDVSILERLFREKYNSTPARYAAKLKHERNNRPRRV
jgi:hypothetical protein